MWVFFYLLCCIMSSAYCIEYALKENKQTIKQTNDYPTEINWPHCDDWCGFSFMYFAVSCLLLIVLCLPSTRKLPLSNFLRVSDTQRHVNMQRKGHLATAGSPERLFSLWKRHNGVKLLFEGAFLFQIRSMFLRERKKIGTALKGCLTKSPELIKFQHSTIQKLYWILIGCKYLHEDFWKKINIPYCL